jgi:hypothetical protein
MRWRRRSWVEGLRLAGMTERELNEALAVGEPREVPLVRGIMALLLTEENLARERSEVAGISNADMRAWVNRAAAFGEAQRVILEGIEEGNRRAGKVG